MTDSPARPAAFGTVACGLCQRYEATRVHALDQRRAEFRVYGKGQLWGSPVVVCDRCDQLLRGGDVDGLVSVDPRAAELSGADLVEQVRNGVQALLVADLGGTDINQNRPAGYRDLIRQGFIPLENITGAVYLGSAWPTEHCRTLPVTDPAAYGHLPDGKHWFVRSPWSSIALEPLLNLVLRTAEAVVDRRSVRGDEQQRMLAAVRELLAGDEDDVAAKLRP